jgi:hypothetical protein
MKISNFEKDICSRGTGGGHVAAVEEGQHAV